MALKTYNQNCGLAAALDVIGERWTLLLVRALLAGPARFNELQAQLPGIGTNLLAARLKTLSRRKLVEKDEGSQRGYRLTPRGEALRPILIQLAAWGRDYLPLPGGDYRSSWTMFNLEAAFRPERSGDVEAIVEFRMAGKPFHLVIRRQTCRAVAGPALSPDLVIHSPGEQWLGEGARLQIQGDAEIFDRVRPCFEL